MKISKRVREEAARLLLVAVSDSSTITSATWMLDASASAEGLAWSAMDALIGIAWQAGLPGLHDRRVEAAALLRDGWSPGDPVEPWKVPAC